MHVGAAGLAYLAGVFLLYCLFGILIPEARHGAVVVAVLAGTAIVPAVAVRLSRPYRLIIVDSDRGIVKLQTPSRAYMDMVNKRAWEYEGKVTLAVPPPLPNCPTP
jgi:hypothetical protein